MHRNKGAEGAAGPFQTPDPQGRPTGVSVVLFVYTHISDRQGEGHVLTSAARGDYMGALGHHRNEKCPCCVEDRARCGLAPKRCPTAAKNVESSR